HPQADLQKPLHGKPSLQPVLHAEDSLSIVGRQHPATTKTAAASIQRVRTRTHGLGDESPVGNADRLSGITSIRTWLPWRARRKEHLPTRTPRCGPPTGNSASPRR